MDIEPASSNPGPAVTSTAPIAVVAAAAIARHGTHHHQRVGPSLANSQVLLGDLIRLYQAREIFAFHHSGGIFIPTYVPSLLLCYGLSPSVGQEGNELLYSGLPIKDQPHGSWVNVRLHTISGTFSPSDVAGASVWERATAPAWKRLDLRGLPLL